MNKRKKKHEAVIGLSKVRPCDTRCFGWGPNTLGKVPLGAIQLPDYPRHAAPLDGGGALTCGGLGGARAGRGLAHGPTLSVQRLQLNGQ